MRPARLVCFIHSQLSHIINHIYNNKRERERELFPRFFSDDFVCRLQRYLFFFNWDGPSHLISSHLTGHFTDLLSVD